MPSISTTTQLPAEADIPLSVEQLQALVAMPLTFLRQQYPNHIMHLMNSDADALSPRQLHPIFYGCFDWHSAVHGYWLLVRSLRLQAELPAREAIIALFDQHFNADNVRRERDYFTAPSRSSFERPYGYAWLLALAAELAQSSLAQAPTWYQQLQPLTLEIRHRLLEYLQKLSYPIRVGTHFNTAFALVLAWDYSCVLSDTDLQQAISAAAQRFYLHDTNYPVHYEPAGDDYLSGALIEALLMSRLLADDFAGWFAAFLPHLAENQALTTPAMVSDRTDPKIAHLDGLNLSRAWCMKSLARKLPADCPHRVILWQSARQHLQASDGHVIGSHYSGGHWLATFALLAHTG